VAHVAVSSLIWASLVAAAAGSRACWTVRLSGALGRSSGAVDVPELAGTPEPAER
jgi:hypothetical protein